MFPSYITYGFSRAISEPVSEALEAIGRVGELTLIPAPAMVAEPFIVDAPKDPHPEILKWRNMSDWAIFCRENLERPSIVVEEMTYR